VCQSAGNVQIDDSPGGVGYSPYGDEGFLLGTGYWGGGGGFVNGFRGDGGFHGDGFGAAHGGGHR